MANAHNILIHSFDTSSTEVDDEGDRLLGFYYQFTDKLDQPVSGMIGPYQFKDAVESAAHRAFDSNDF